MRVYNDGLTNIINDLIINKSDALTVIHLQDIEHYFYFEDENPFKTVAYIIHTLSGRCDSEFLEAFGLTEKDLCPFGERIRTYNKSRELNFIFNPIDQLIDAYKKLVNGQEGVISLYNPYFDAYEENEFSENGSKSVINAVFSVKNNKLEEVVTVTKTNAKTLFNEFLGVFKTLLDLLAVWINKEVGNITLIVSEIEINEKPMQFIRHFNLESAKFETSIEDTNDFLDILNQSGMIETILDDNFMVTEQAMTILETFKTIPDPVLKELAVMLLIYRANLLGNTEATLEGLKAISEAKRVKAMRYLYPYLKELKEFKALYKDMDEDIRRYIENKRQRAF